MFHFENVAALIPAAGSGSRLGLGPKAFLKFGKKSLLQLAVEKVIPHVSRINVGVQEKYMGRAQNEVGNMACVFRGGPTRQQTIFNLFKDCAEELILIFDVTHPFAGSLLMEKVIQTAVKYGTAVPVVAGPSPVGISADGTITDSVPAGAYCISQMPQAFQRELLEESYLCAEEQNIVVQSTWQLILNTGKSVHTIEGEEENIKITTAYDWELARKIVSVQGRRQDCLD